MNLKEQKRKEVERKNKMDNDSKFYKKLEEIRALLFVLIVVELYKFGVNQGTIAKMLKTSKTAVNKLLKETSIGNEKVK